MGEYYCVKCSESWIDDRPAKRCPYCGAKIERKSKGGRRMNKPGRVRRTDKYSMEAEIL